MRMCDAISNENVIWVCGMKGLFSTSEAAKKPGVSLPTLQRHVLAKIMECPHLQNARGVSVRLWLLLIVRYIS
jgi:hypothetical protein